MADIQLGGSVGTTGTAILGRANIVIPTDADYTLLVTEYTNQYLYVTSSVSLTATRNIIVPVAEGVEYVIFNGTTGSQAIQIIGTFGTGINIPTQQTVSVVCDGTNMVSLGGVVSGISGSIVFQPGGNVVAANYFSNESALQTATTAIVGPKSIFFDFSQNSNTYTAAGSFDFGTETTWVGLINQIGSVVPVLNTAFQITNPPNVIEDLQINCTFGGTVFGAASPVDFKMLGRSVITCDASTTLYTVNGGGLRLTLDDGATLGDNVNSCITITSGEFLVYVNNGASLESNAITLAGGTLKIFQEMGANLSETYYAAPGITIQGLLYGTSSSANGANSITVGDSCLTTGANTIAMGTGAVAGLDDMIAIGAGTGIRSQFTQTVGIVSNNFLSLTGQEFVTTDNTAYMWTVRITARDTTVLPSVPSTWEYKATGLNQAGTLTMQDPGTLIYSSLGTNTWTVTFSVGAPNIFRFTLNGTNVGQTILAFATVEWTYV